VHKPTQLSFAAATFKLCSSVASFFSKLLCATAVAPHKGKRAIELLLQVAKVNDGIAPESLTIRLKCVCLCTHPSDTAWCCCSTAHGNAGK